MLHTKHQLIITDKQTGKRYLAYEGGKNACYEKFLHLLAGHKLPGCKLTIVKCRRRWFKRKSEH